MPECAAPALPDKIAGLSAAPHFEKNSATSVYYHTMRRGGSTSTEAEDEAEAGVLLLEVPPKEKGGIQSGEKRIRGLKGSRNDRGADPGWSQPGFGPFAGGRFGLEARVMPDVAMLGRAVFNKTASKRVEKVFLTRLASRAVAQLWYTLHWAR